MPNLPNELNVLLGNQIIGRVIQPPDGRREFQYVNDWKNIITPISLSMPQQEASYNYLKIDSYMWGLIPDSIQTREQLGVKYDISYRNPMAILSKIGLDCAGAVQFCVPNQTEKALKGKGNIIPLSDRD
ncbi:MAG: HipA N-terminal domain-containing protein, partial [Clostridiales Family XIII bacterium]|nr:HipA N-terminal domain-containing protein [Clostridiales Family XIII bacterium]